MREDNNNWEPNIVGFLCNWCSYAGADLAGTSRMEYPDYQGPLLQQDESYFCHKMLDEGRRRGADFRLPYK